MNEQDELAGRIAKLLEDSADSVPPAHRQRLYEARQKALQIYRAKAERKWAPAWLLELVMAGGPAGPTTSRYRYFLPMAALILGLAGLVYMHSSPNGSPDIADIDAGLLTDELPLNAFLDTSLDAWLKRSPR